MASLGQKAFALAVFSSLGAMAFISGHSCWVYLKRQTVQQDTDALLSQAEALSKSGKTTRALQIYYSLAQEHPRNGMVYFQRGQTLVSVGDYAGALQNMERSIALGYPEVDALLWHGLISGRFFGKWEEQIRDATRALARNPLSADACLIRAQALAQLHVFPLALSDLDKAVSLRPGDAFIRASRGQVKLLAGDGAGARMDAVGALSLDGGLSIAWELLGDAAMEDSHPRQADYYYTKAKSAAPDDLDLVYLRAKARLASGDTTGAAADMRGFLFQAKEVSLSPSFLSENARLFYRAGEFSTAVEFADAAVRFSGGDNAQLLALRARIRYEEGDTEGALSDWQACAKLANCPDAQKALSKVNRSAGK